MIKFFTLFTACILSVTTLNAQNYEWAKSFGSPSYDQGKSISVDASGNVYTTGYFYGTVDFDPGAGTANFTSAGYTDVFVQKLDASGNLLWAKSFGGTSSEKAYSMSTDASGNVYTTGVFQGTVDFDPGEETANITSAGSNDIFVQKLDASGNFIWAKSFGASSYDLGKSINIDASGNVYTTGYFNGTVDFDPGEGTATLTSAGNHDIFVLKMDALGNFIWAKSFGGTSFDTGNSIITDASGNVYVTGAFQETVDFAPGAGGATLTSAGNEDIFVLKMDASGNFIWARSFGGASSDEGNSISINALGNVYTTGYFSGTVDFDHGTGTANLISVGYEDVYVQKLDASGTFLWAKSFGGADYDNASSISLDASGNVYTTGTFQETVDFDPGEGTANITSAGGYDIFIHKLDASGNFLWTKSFGMEGTDEGNSIKIDDSGNIYTTGYFNGTVDFDPGAGTSNLISAGGSDIYLQKIAVATLGIIENNFGEKLIIYPNPTNGNFSIDLGSAYETTKISIIDITGKMIYSKSFNQTQIVNLSLEAPAGIYTVLVQSGKRKAFFKLIKK